MYPTLLRKATLVAQLLNLGLLLATAPTLRGQTPVVADTFYTPEYLDRSTRFAWTTLGADLLLLPSGRVQLPGQGETTFGPTLLPRLTIGGIHFWGHADFYVTFPLPLRRDFSSSAFEKVNYSEGVETGARLYPWRVREGALRPYVGISFKSLTYGHALPNAEYGRGFPLTQRFIGPLQAGLTYTGRGWLWSAGLHYLRRRDFEYAVSPTEMGTGTFRPFSFTLSVLKYWDVDSGARTERGFQQENIKHKLLESKGKMSAFYWGIGPSATLQLGRSPYLEAKHPALYRKLTGGMMPDVAFGYHFARPDLNVGLSYRFMADGIAAFDTRIGLRRHSSMLEGYKFLFNYLGFVPYAGLTLSMENLAVQVNDRTVAETKPAVGVIFGWDIRVTRTGTSLLRTNLRYIPRLAVDVDGHAMRFDHLEFNFIQYVRYIGRRNFYKGYQAKK